MNQSNCSTERSDLFQTISTLYLVILLVLGTALNVLALWVFCCRMRRWTEMRVYMANLAGADCCLLLSLPVVLYTMNRDHWEGSFLCTVSQSIYLINGYMSISIITAIAMDRYAAIQYPLRARKWRSPQQAAGTCAVLWLLVICVVSLPAAWKQDGKSFCFGKSQTRSFWAIVSSLVLFFIPFVILVFCSVRVLRNLVRKKAQEPTQGRRLFRKAYHVVLANLIIFMVCFLPQHVALLAKLVAEYMEASCPIIQHVITSVRVASRLANANCCLDALGYYYVVQEFQEEVGMFLAMPKFLQSQTPDCPGSDYPDLPEGKVEVALKSAQALHDS
ncbi:G-protein coupled receptor 35-like [Monodelphis domestica]|uniref:G-protein coupled receptor 35-like n=1 Tax=Monodelphis domestica TaxID=13616 RepID=F6YQL0_MONDO|nr:G-protein coupled receptor 35-like [Monodelphis domestica]